MTTQFHEGQEVEVLAHPELSISVKSRWRKAKIVRPNVKADGQLNSNSWTAEIQFHDGTRAVFDVEHMRLSRDQIEQELIANGERFLDAMS